MKVRINGTKLTGTATEILEGMRENAFFAPEGSLDDYIEYLKDSTYRFHRVQLKVTGNTLEERATSVLQGLEKAGLIKIVKEGDNEAKG